MSTTRIRVTLIAATVILAVTVIGFWTFAALSTPGLTWLTFWIGVVVGVIGTQVVLVILDRTAASKRSSPVRCSVTDDRGYQCLLRDYDAWSPHGGHHVYGVADIANRHPTNLRQEYPNE